MGSRSRLARRRCARRCVGRDQRERRERRAQVDVVTQGRDPVLSRRHDRAPRQGACERRAAPPRAPLRRRGPHLRRARRRDPRPRSPTLDGTLPRRGRRRHGRRRRSPPARPGSGSSAFDRASCSRRRAASSNGCALRSSSARADASEAASSGGAGSRSTTSSRPTASRSPPISPALVNLTSPNPVTNAQFTKALGRALDRPTVVPFPGVAAKTVFGEMGEEILLGSQRALPARLLDAGFDVPAPGPRAGARAGRRRVSSTDEARELTALGWDDAWEAAFEPHRRQGLEPGRVAAPHRGGAYDVFTTDSEVRAHLPGSHAAHVVDRRTSRSSATGSRSTSRPTPRRSRPCSRARTKISRRAAHDPGSDVAREQVVAANVDVVFVTASLADEPSPRLLERYLTLAWESGARPAILLLKADLEPDPERVADELGGDRGRRPDRRRVDASRPRARPRPRAARPRHAPALSSVLPASGSRRSSTRSSARTSSTPAKSRTTDRATHDDASPARPPPRRWHRRRQPRHPRAPPLARRRRARRGVRRHRRAGVAQCRFADCRHETEPGCAVQAALASGDAVVRAVGELPRAPARARRARGAARAARAFPRPAPEAGRGNAVGLSSSRRSRHPASSSS